MKLRRKIYSDMIKLSVMMSIAIIVFGSCQRVIHVDLNTANSQVVIQAYVTDQPDIDTVLITKTGSYFTPGGYAGVNGATVIVTDNMGTTDTFIQVDSGKYAAMHLTGIPGRTYTMKVLVYGKEYDAVSTMPMPVNIDSLLCNIVGSGSDTSYHVHVYFADPASTTDFYMVQGYINGTLQDSAGNITLNRDKYTNGLEQNVRLRIPNPFPHDSVRVNLLTIDANIYNYFTVLRSITRGSNPVSTATPQNPPTNILGGALGYFSAHTLRTKSIVMP